MTQTGDAPLSGDDSRLNDRPPLSTQNDNTVWADRYIDAKGFGVPDHLVRRAMVDITRPNEDGIAEGRVVYDDPRDPGIVV